MPEYTKHIPYPTWAPGEFAPVPKVGTPDTSMTDFGKDLIKEVLSPNCPRLIVSDGGVGSSKSISIAQAIRVIALTRPGANILMTGLSLSFLTSVLKKAMETVFGPSVKWKGGSTEPKFTFPNGSEVLFRSYQNHGTTSESSNSLEGLSMHAIFVDEVEQLSQTIFDHALERCRIPMVDVSGVLHNPIVVMTGRPGNEMFHIQKCLELRAKGMETLILRPKTWDNEFLWIYDQQTGLPFSPYLENLRANLSEPEFNCKTQHILGSEMPSKGSVYSDFVAAEYPKGNLYSFVYDNRECYAAIDFGRSYPAVEFICEVTIGGKKRDVIFDEIQKDEVLTKELIGLIKEKGYNLKACIVDPAGSTSNAQTGLSDIQLLQNELRVPIISTRSKVKTRVLTGVSKVRSRICNADKERRLLVSKNLWERSKQAPAGSRTIRLILSYTFKIVDRALSVTKGGAGQSDHVCDALRYFIINMRWEEEQVIKPSMRSDFDLSPAPSRFNNYRNAGR